MATPGVEINEQTKYFGYIYIWCDTKRNKYYIGSHKGSVLDKYTSGCKWVNNVIKSRPETMIIRILEFYYGNDRKELYQIEDKWLKFYDVQNNPNFYNMKNEACGGSGAFPHKGKKRSEYSPGWIDHRKGKTAEQIYKDPVKFRNNLSKLNKDYYKVNGHGKRKGIKTKSVDPRKGKTVEEIYGHRRIVNPPKPFIVFIKEPGIDEYNILCEHELDFFQKIKLESTGLQILKNIGTKIITKRQSTTKHSFPKGTILKLKFLDKTDK